MQKLFGKMRAAVVLLLCTVLLVIPVQQVEAAPSRAECHVYTALGDSLGQGLWASRGYVLRYYEYAVQDTRECIVVVNLSVSGWTSADLLNALRTNPVYRNAVRNSKIVTWDIGGNDLIRARDRYKSGTCGGADNQDCLRQAQATFEANWSAIIAEILSLRKVKNTVIRTMDIYNPYVNEDQASDTYPNDTGNDFVVFKPYIDAINSYIASTAGANRIPYARVYAAFNGPNGDVDPESKGYISPDDLHPNDLGHKVIADLFRSLGYAPLKR